MKPTVLIVIPAILLFALSLTMLASIAPERVLIQLFFGLISILVGWGVWAVGAKNWLLLSAPVYFGVLILLFLTVFFGRVTRGSTRWLAVGELRVQASELAKPAVLILSAAMLKEAWPHRRREQLAKLLRVSWWVAPVILVVAVQPDLGTTISLAVILLAVLLFSDLPKWIVVGMTVLAVMAVPMGRSFLADYQLRRIEAFVNPYADPRGAGYQVIQSTIAVGSGMWWGRGLGHGTQSQLKFLPERHTDFIFASIVEELGLVGGGVALVLYVVLITGLVLAVLGSRTREQWLIITGVAAWLFFQASVNVAMNMGLMPVTGITLPFLSAGGSSLVSSAVMIALAVSAAAE